MLKEQCKCNIVLILNSDALTPDDKKEFESHIEKIVDTEIIYSPTPTHAAECAFGKEHSLLPIVTECVKSLDIKNIRIIQRAKKTLDTLKNHYQTCEKETINHIVRSIILFTCSVYCKEDKDKNIPTLEYILDLNQNKYIPNESPPSHNEKWLARLIDYQYLKTDSLDYILAEYIQNGYFSKEQFKSILQDHNKTALSSRNKNEYNDAWKIYKESFNDNKTIFLKKLETGFTNNISSMSFNDLTNTASIFRDFNENEIATKIINQFITLNKTSFINMEIDSFRINDEYILEKIKQIKSEAYKKQSIENILKHISQNNGHTSHDEEALVEFPINDYVLFFKSIPGDSLHKTIYNTKQHFQCSNSTDRQKLIQEKVENALKIIASESEINKIRIKNFHGITIK